MILDKQQALKVITENLVSGLQRLLLQSKLQAVIDTLYGQGYAISQGPPQSNYAAMSLQESVQVVCQAAMMCGITMPIQQQATEGLSKLQRLGYVFVRRQK